jgi:hypothetical protein
LANELMLDLFEYLPTAHILSAFGGLNLRFHALILVYFQVSRQFDCRLMSKHQLDSVCEQHLSPNISRILSLCLSDADDTPQLIDRFLSHGLNLDQFTGLRSLSLYHVHCEKIMKKTMVAWSHLIHLTHLNLIDCCFQYSQQDVLGMMNSIWSLPKLTYCHLHISSQLEPYFVAPTVASTSIEYLYIQGVYCRQKELARLFEHTPRLRHLYANINARSDNHQFEFSVPSMISLELKFCLEDATHVMNRLLQTMPNLRRLTVETSQIYLDGHEWKRIIVDHLPKLKVFRLKMEFYFRDRNNKKQYVDQLLESFRSKFWLEERQWFIRCHWYPQMSSNYACLYTLPYTFANFPRIDINRSQSICSNVDKNDWSYDRVHTLDYRAPLIGDLSLCHCEFNNVEHLSLSLPLNDQFWILVPRLDRLASLEVSLHDSHKDVQYQLQSVLDRAPHLSSLKFGSWLVSEVPIGEITSASVRQLDLRECNRWYSNQECLTLISSPLGRQCEALRINVENPRNILDLVTKMNNLRALNVRCESDKENERSATNDKIVEWLQHCLPSTYTVIRHSCHKLDILLWIR